MSEEKGFTHQGRKVYHSDMPAATIEMPPIGILRPELEGQRRSIPQDSKYLYGVSGTGKSVLLRTWVALANERDDGSATYIEELQLHTILDRPLEFCSFDLAWLSTRPVLALDELWYSPNWSAISNRARANVAALIERRHNLTVDSPGAYRTFAASNKPLSQAPVTDQERRRLAEIFSSEILVAGE